MMSPKSRKWDQKIKKNRVKISRFSSFCFWPQQNWVQAAPHVLKHVEKQSETGRVQSSGAKSGASADQTPAQQFKNQNESSNCPLSNAL